jgi:hypothetical protein
MTVAELFSTDELKVRSDDRTKMIPRSTREWWSQTGSNRRPPACKAGALPTELWPRPWIARLRQGCGGQPSLVSGLPAEAAQQRRLVGLGRLELPTSRLSSARSNQLSYKPLILTNGRIRHRGKHAAAGADIRHGLVREEREMKTAESRQMGSD